VRERISWKGVEKTSGKQNEGATLKGRTQDPQNGSPNIANNSKMRRTPIHGSTCTQLLATNTTKTAKSSVTTAVNKRELGQDKRRRSKSMNNSCVKQHIKI
jgi:hypothetical protein